MGVKSVLKTAALGVAALFAMSMATTGVSYADTFQFTSDHCTGTCGTPPFGTVTLTQVGTSVDFTVSLAAGVGWAQTGAGDGQLFKFNGAPSLASITNITSSGFTGQTLQGNTGSFSGDGTGDFVFGISCSTCGNGNVMQNASIMFVVTNSTIAALTGTNNKGIIFVADILGTNGNTGPVDVSPPAPVPLPPAAMLFGSALVGLGFLTRRRRSADHVSPDFWDDYPSSQRYGTAA